MILSVNYVPVNYVPVNNVPVNNRNTKYQQRNELSVIQTQLNVCMNEAETAEAMIFRNKIKDTRLNSVK